MVETTEQSAHEQGHKRPAEKKAPESPKHKRARLLESSKQQVNNIVSDSHIPQSNPALKFLAGKDYKEVLGHLKDNKVISVKPSDSILKVGEVFEDRGVHSVPIIEEGKCTGLVDVVDLAECIIRLFAHKPVNSLKDDNAVEYLMTDAAVSRMEAMEISDVSLRNHFHPLYPSTSKLNMLAVSRILALGSVQCIPILNDDGALVDLITPTAVLQYINQHASELRDSELDLTVKDVTEGIRHQHLVTAKRTMPALSAFRLMHNRRVDCVAIVDDEGVLTETLSASDLRLFSEWFMSGVKLKVRDLHQLTLPVAEFLANLRKLQKTEATAKPGLLTVKEGDTVSTALRVMATHHLHHLHVVDSSGKPTATLSASCVLRGVLCHHATEDAGAAIPFTPEVCPLCAAEEQRHAQEEAARPTEAAVEAAIAN